MKGTSFLDVILTSILRGNQRNADQILKLLMNGRDCVGDVEGFRIVIEESYSKYGSVEVLAT